MPDFFNDNGSRCPPSINLAIKTFKPSLGSGFLISFEELVFALSKKQLLISELCQK